MTIYIHGGHLIDPISGIDSAQDLLLRDGQVAAVGHLTPAQTAGAHLQIDASGKIVCPGFLDIHMHEDPVGPDGHIKGYADTSIFPAMLRMGVTTAIAGNCGENKYHPADYLDLADRDGLPIHVGMLAGHEFFRHRAGCADNYAPSTPAQRARMAAEIEDSLARGCLGVSFGLRYVPGMDTGELLETAAPLQKYRGLLAAHIRDDAAAVFDALREFLDAALQLDAPVQVSHIGSMAGFGQMADFLSLLDSYRLRRPDIACDCYPYDVFCTSIGSATFDDGWLERYNCGYDAVELCEGKYKGQRCTKEIFEEVRREHPEYLVVCYVMQQSEVDLAFTHPAVMVGSDGTLYDGQGHPRAAGAFPRLLSRYVKSKTITLYDAVSRMTSLPAAQLGLAKKGGLRPGMDADVVIFDPETIEDRSTFAQPLTPPQGIDWVIVGGTPAVEHGRVTHLHAGHSVRAERGV